MSSSSEKHEQEQAKKMDEVKAIHERISTMVKKLNEIHTDVAVIKETCKTRGKTCASRVDNMDKTLRGNGTNGVLTRLASTEQKIRSIDRKGSGREKFAYLVIGILLSGCVSLIIAMVIRLSEN